MIFGYCRVSTEAQNLERQIDALKKYGVPEQNIYTEKATGTKKHRPELDELKKVLELHKQQLAVVNRNIPIYEANNWLPNLETAKREKEGLERIIAALERLQKGGDMDASDSA